MLEQLTSADFSPHLNHTFTVTLIVPPETPGAVDGQQTRQLKLIEVADLKAYSDAARRPFSLIFHDSGAGYLAQGTYPIEHPELGVLDMFIVPVSAGHDGARYQAIFT